MQEYKIKEKISHACHLLHSIRLVCGASGNISVRYKNKIFLTPTGRHKGFVTPEEIVTLDIEGNIIEGKGKPSCELPMHLAIYKTCKDVQAIVHAHPPWVLSLDLANKKIDPSILVETAIFFKKIPIVEYFPPGSKELAQAVSAEAQKAPIIILSKHGAISYADHLERAIEYMEYLEHAAQIHTLTNIMKEA